MKLKEPYEAEERSILTVMGQQDSRIDGDFRCSYNKLTSLEGGPQEVGGDFSCSSNELKSLEGCPQEVGGNFQCSYNKLTSLEGGPKEVGGNFSCSFNKLISLEGAPERIGGDFYCHSNQLTSLEGAPERIGEDFYCSGNQLTSLKDIHKHIKSIIRNADFAGNPIKSHVVGLLLIEGLVYVILDNKKVQAIINKHLRANRDVLACIEELEDAGYSEFAKI